MSKHLNNWSDFEVVSSDINVLGTKALYECYKIFRDTFDQLPKSELIKRGWINETGDIVSMLPLYKDILSGKNSALYKKNNTANDILCSAWLSKVTESAKITVAVDRIPEFSGIDKAYLTQLAKLSIDETILLKLPEILAKKGIVLIYEHALPGMKLDGVVFKLESGHPIIGVSFRFPRLDNFWFTLMHELSHIHLHLGQLDNTIFDDLEMEDHDFAELQANRLAKSSFVSREIWRNCEPKYHKSDEVLISFSNKIGVHPAIIAGMLRKEENSYTMYSDIVNRVDTRKMVFTDD